VAVEFAGDGVEVGLGVGAEVEGAAGEMFAQEIIGVFVAAALPQAWGRRSRRRGRR